MKTRTNHPSDTEPEDAISFLKADHQELREGLRALSETSERATAKRSRILSAVAPALWVHMQIEERIFYPALEAERASADDEVISLAARAEHRGVKAALARLEACEIGSTEVRAMARVIQALAEQHMVEEENEMFPRARQLLGRGQLHQLGARLARTRADLLFAGDFERGENAMWERRSARRLDHDVYFAPSPSLGPS